MACLLGGRPQRVAIAPHLTHVCNELWDVLYTAGNTDAVALCVAISPEL